MQAAGEPMLLSSSYPRDLQDAFDIAAVARGKIAVNRRERKRVGLQSGFFHIACFC